MCQHQEGHVFRRRGQYIVPALAKAIDAVETAAAKKNATTRVHSDEPRVVRWRCVVQRTLNQATISNNKQRGIRDMILTKVWSDRGLGAEKDVRLLVDKVIGRNVAVGLAEHLHRTRVWASVVRESVLTTRSVAASQVLSLNDQQRPQRQQEQDGRDHLIQVGTAWVTNIIAVTFVEHLANKLAPIDAVLRTRVAANQEFFIRNGATKCIRTSRTCGQRPSKPNRPSTSCASC